MWSNDLEVNLCLLSVFQAEQDAKDGRVGDELARLSLAIRAFHEANKEAENITTLVLGPHWKKTCTEVELKHKKRTHENNTIYKVGADFFSSRNPLDALLVSDMILPSWRALKAYDTPISGKDYSS